MPDTPKDEAFLSRWARMKREGGEPEPAEAASTPAPQTEPEEPLSDSELLERLGLPDPASLRPGDDVRGFLNAEVPEHLRRMALRFLWRSNPVLANVDGLVDYGEDFTDAATVMENLQTIYEVGKGAAWKFKAEQEAAALAEAEREAESAPEPPLHRTTGEDPDADPETAATEVAETEEIQAADSLDATPSEPVAVTAARPRPMQFEFD